MEVGEALADFIMVDTKSSDKFYSTYARILVDIDASKGLTMQIKLCIPIDFLIQSLDYEGLTFRYRICFNTRHVVAKCEKLKSKRSSSWWKRALLQYYTVSKLPSIDEETPFKSIVA